MLKLKKKKKEDEIPKTKLTKGILVFCGVLIALFLIVFVLSLFFPSFASFFWFNVRNPFFNIMFSICQFFPSLGMNFSWVIFGIIVILELLSFYFERSKKICFDKKVAYINIVNSGVYLLFIFMLLPLLFNLVSFTVPKIDSMYLNDVKDNSYTKDDLVELNMYFKDKILDMADDFKRNNGAIIYDEKLEEVAINNLLNISNKYEFLDRAYPHKFASFTEKEYAENYDDVLGYTKLYGVSLDYELNNVILGYTVQHELCHVKGVMRESETEYCAFLAGINSDDKFSNYGAYLNAFANLNYALYSIDSNIANDIEEEVMRLCLVNGYDEICNFYYKNLNHYLKDASDFYITSYRLGSYDGYEEKLISIIERLINDYNATLFIDEASIGINDLKQVLENPGFDKYYFDVVIPINEKNFDNLSSFLNDYDNYFLCIYQNFESDEEYDDMSSEEALEYYLSPFDKNDFKLLLNGEYGYEYDYDRVTRLLLEHYDYMFR